jgi:NADPH:quinone reductase-like Zn-dependent oxidoreductase
MRAARVIEFGKPEVLTVLEIEEPRPTPDEVLIGVRAAGVNQSDLASARRRMVWR